MVHVTRVCVFSYNPSGAPFVPKAETAEEEWRKHDSRRGGQRGAEVEKEEGKEEVAG